MRIFWGVVLVVLGSLFALQSFGVLPVALPFWPVVLTVIGFYNVVSAVLPWPFRWREGAPWVKLSLGAWLGGIGVFDLLHVNGVTALAGRDVWSVGWFVLLIGLGLALIFGRNHYVIYTGKGSREWKKWGSGWNWIFGPYSDDDSSAFAMGDLHYGREPWVLDRDLAVRHRVGDVRIDLTTAEITEGTHEVDIDAGVGEVVVLVPDDCNANVRANVGTGSLKVFGEGRDGLGVHMEKNYVVPDASATLNISVRLRVGHVAVRRVPSRRVEG